MREIEIGYVSSHYINDHKARIAFIEATIGIGNPVAEAPDLKHDNATLTLTDTGVVVVKNATSGMVVTAWVASMSQGRDIYSRGRHERLPENLLWKLHYYNNTRSWQQVAA